MKKFIALSFLGVMATVNFAFADDKNAYCSGLCTKEICANIAEGKYKIDMTRRLKNCEKKGCPCPQSSNDKHSSK